MNIVCFGNSLTACGGENGSFSDVLQQRFPQHIFINKGMSGATFEDARAQLQTDVCAHNPDIVLLEFGANDWKRNERPYKQWAEDLEYCITRIKEQGAEIVILGVFGPCRGREGAFVPKTTGTDKHAVLFQKLESEIAAQYNCSYIPNIQERIINNRCCWLDENHPNEYGNRFVADTIEPVLEKLLASKALPLLKPDLCTIRDLWSEAARLAPETCAVVYGQQRLAYGEADTLVKRLGAGFLDLSKKHRPTVAVFLPNCLEYYLTYWAVAHVGGVIVPLNTWLREKSLAEIFHNIQPDILVIQNPSKKEPLKAAQTCSSLSIVSIEPGEDTCTLFSELLKNGDQASASDISPEDLAVIMHTSGTTGMPKGAMMRHSDLLFNVMTTINAHQFFPRDVHLIVNPMFHCTPLYSSLPAAAYQKTPVIITDSTSPGTLMKIVREERITTFLTTPYILQQIVKIKDLASYDYSSLRLIGYAGSPMPVNTIRTLQQSFPGVDLHNFFGLTETISMTHVLSGEEASERLSSIGRLLPFVEAIIVDKQHNEVPAGTEGELLFARENVICGYFNNEEKMKASVRTIKGREWFATGDIATVDEEGYFYIKGREKDMIIVGGENVYASEIEAVLMRHTKVQDAAVKGVSATGTRSPLGELIKAYIVPDDTSLTEKEIKKYCFDSLASYQIPHFFVFLQELPRNPAGKIVKSKLP